MTGSESFTRSFMMLSFVVAALLIGNQWQSNPLPLLLSQISAQSKQTAGGAGGNPVIPDIPKDLPPAGEAIAATPPTVPPTAEPLTPAPAASAPVAVAASPSPGVAGSASSAAQLRSGLPHANTSPQAISKPNQWKVALPWLSPAKPTEPVAELRPLLLTMHVDIPQLIVDLSDRKVYFYKGDQLQTSYDVAVGQSGWETPVGTFEVSEMLINPPWEHPITKELIGADPRNPLGTRWIGFWSDGVHVIGFHGTNQSDSVGQAVSHGCLRMRNQDIEAMYAQVALGTPVMVRQ